jgi:hypothetical protein
VPAAFAAGKDVVPLELKGTIKLKSYKPARLFGAQILMSIEPDTSPYQDNYNLFFAAELFLGCGV